MASRSDPKQSARERVAAERAAQAERDRRQRLIRIVGGAVLLVAIVGGGFWWQQSQAEVEVTDAGPQVPSELTADGIAVGEAEAPVVDVYLDFLCSHCAEMEERIGDTIDELALDGDAKFVVHPLTFLDPQESARSAAAFGCSAGTESVLGFQAALFENAGGGFSTERLVEIGEGAGLDDDALQCIRDGGDTEWAADVTAAAQDRKIKGTPTIFVDGEEMDLDLTATPEQFREAIAAAG